MSDFWVFGYGSLMWRPGFDHAEAVTALLPGAHRSLCIYSRFYRGTQEEPGLVLCLDRGGACTGLAYRVTGKNRESVIAYLHERELVTDAYRGVWRPVILAGDHARKVPALTYVVDRSHVRYAGNLSRPKLQAQVRSSVGKSGAMPNTSSTPCAICAWPESGMTHRSGLPPP